MPSKLTNRVRIAAEYFRRKAVLEGGPLEVSLESTAKCNLYCPMCPRHVYTFDNESMDLELYKKIIRDCKDYVEFVWPYGIGEPMIHPNIFEMIRLTRDAGIRTGMSTNATMLDDKRADMLLDCGLDYAIFAFDGASKETYEKYRTGATFEKTRQNILNFLEKKQQRKSPIYVVLQMVLLKENKQEIDAYRKLWAIPGVDEIRFKRDEIQTRWLKDSRASNSRISVAIPAICSGAGPSTYDTTAWRIRAATCGKNPPWAISRSNRLWRCGTRSGWSTYGKPTLTATSPNIPPAKPVKPLAPVQPAFYGSLAFNSLTVRKAVPAMEKLARFYKVGIFEKN